MKKFLTIVLIIIIIAAALLVCLNWHPSETEFEVPTEPSYSEELLNEYNAALEKGDYVAMNAAFDENMEQTGVSFFEEEYDPTHGGKIYSYPYSIDIENNGEETSGVLYVITSDVNISAQSAGENDYFALDRRDAADPEFVVYDSYRAQSDKLIRRLCRILLNHEEAHPTAWERTLDSMAEEWQMHNASYEMDYKIDHAKDVNLNNGDENTDWMERTLEELS